jgi:hypothetical protein
MAFSFGTGWCKTYSEGRTPFLLILFGCGYAALGDITKLTNSSFTSRRNGNFDNSDFDDDDKADPL